MNENTPIPQEEPKKEKWYNKVVNLPWYADFLIGTIINFVWGGLHVIGTAFVISGLYKSTHKIEKKWLRIILTILLLLVYIICLSIVSRIFGLE